MHGHHPRGRFAAKGFWIIGGIIFTLVFAFVFAVIVMLLWNWLMPTIFGLPVITYWQAWGLILLSHILVKGHGFKYGSQYREARLKEKFRDRIHDRMDFEHWKDYCPSHEEREPDTNENKE